MSWADDIRCLYCDGRLPLYRKITNGQFCSSAHRKAYWQEQERLAVERLHQTHDSLRAYRPAGSIEAILGQTETTQETERPRWLTLANTGQVPVIGFYPSPVRIRPQWMRENPAGAGATPADVPKALRQPVFIYARKTPGVAPASYVTIPLAERDFVLVPATRLAPVEWTLQPAVEVALDFAIDAEYGCTETNPIVDVPEMIPAMAGPVLMAQPAPIYSAFAALGSGRVEPLLASYVELSFRDVRFETGSEPAPRHADLVALPGPGTRNLARIILRVDAAPRAMLLRMRLPLDFAQCPDPAPSAAGAVGVPIFGVPSIATPGDAVQAIDLRAASAGPTLNLSTTQIAPALRLAAGSRYAVRIEQPKPAAVTPFALAVAAPAVALPERRTRIAPARVTKQPATSAAVPQAALIREPNPVGLMALPCVFKARGSDLAAKSGAAFVPEPASSAPMLPALHVEPVHETAGPAVPADFAISMPPYAALEAPLEAGRAHIWTHAIDFWHRAPRDLKLLSIAIPVLLGLALHPALPKVRVASPADTKGMQHSFENAVNTQWTTVRKTLVDRAAVALDEDFRSGLDDWASRWTTRGDSSAEWSFDATGFVRPGPLALYKPSVGLTDYQMQFLGMIDKKAMSWVVRAADFDNFYVVKLEILKPGPLPTLGITRYAVVNGKADSRVDTRVNIDARADTLYRVMMDIHGDEFLLNIQGQVIDAWSEPRLKHGGIGFFSSRGEDSRVRWVQVTHQYDMLGRLCAYLAPYNLPSSSASLQP